MQRPQIRRIWGLTTQVGCARLIIEWQQVHLPGRLGEPGQGPPRWASALKAFDNCPSQIRIKSRANRGFCSLGFGLIIARAEA